MTRFMKYNISLRQWAKMLAQSVDRLRALFWGKTVCRGRNESEILLTLTSLLTFLLTGKGVIDRGVMRLSTLSTIKLYMKLYIGINRNGCTYSMCMYVVCTRVVRACAYARGGVRGDA